MRKRVRAVLSALSISKRSSKASVSKRNRGDEVLIKERTTLTTVFEGENPAVDIVAVHGLNGDAFKTFTATQTGKFWLGDSDMLPQDLRGRCRVLTFSYPASVASILGRASSDTILHHATTLVAELVADREINNALERPIIFVCHSLGGIVVKRALTYSASRTGHKIEHIHSIYVSTFGVLFFGTPHQGSRAANLATIAQRMIDTFVPSRIVDTDSRLLSNLRESSEVLQDITDNFVPIMARLHICFFWEQEKTDLGFKWEYIVVESSAAPILDNTDRAGIRQDHRNMCRFESRSSPSYTLVVATIARYSREAPEAIAHRWAGEREMLHSTRKHEAMELLETANKTAKKSEKELS
ncbi:ribonuclease-like protein p/mrp subunit [Hypoxylon cercidicola]|nr:ribonuclease-like protein p/mrp subunit [Hypoxylon cercidicola]